VQAGWIASTGFERAFAENWTAKSNTSTLANRGWDLHDGLLSCSNYLRHLVRQAGSRPAESAEASIVRAKTLQIRDPVAEAPGSFAAASKTDSVTPLIMNSANKMAVQTLLWALKPLLDLRGSRSIPLPFATTFLMVALDEGKGVNAYARAAGIDRRIMSRYLKDIGARARNGGPGLGLINVEEHPDNPVRTRIFLTAKGRVIADKVFGQLLRLSRPRL
jgi:DNA-binding MarR family transcriptional regulator